MVQFGRVDRTLIPYLRKDLGRKLVLLAGPRQAGKTTLARLLETDHEYLNFDHPEHRTVLQERSWDRRRKLLVLDELHKWKNWKSWLKGLYDVEGLKPPIIVTGSARLDISRKGGDSLAGRFFLYRLHPFDLKELSQLRATRNVEDAFERLLTVGGFPEPFLNGGEEFHRRWRRTHLEAIIRQDVPDLEAVHQLSSIETLVELLRTRTGSPVSHSSLARDLACSDQTVKRWIDLLERLYLIFRVSPYHRNVARSLLKASKLYFFDTGQVRGDDGARLENLVACALLKELHFREDCHGERLSLHYVRTKDGDEVDFLVVRDGKPVLLVEVKWADDAPSSSLVRLRRSFPATPAVQLVSKVRREKTYPNLVEVRRAAPWLAGLSLDGYR